MDQEVQKIEKLIIHNFLHDTDHLKDENVLPIYRDRQYCLTLSVLTLLIHEQKK
jgi:hypothetical protein